MDQRDTQGSPASDAGLEQLVVRLRDAEDRLRAVTQQVRIGLAVTGPDHRYRFANQAYADLLRLPTGDLVGQRVADVLPEVYETQIRPRLDRALTGETVSYELVTPAHGELQERRYAVTYQPGREESGEPEVTVVVQDITEQATTARRLRDSEERFRAAVQAVQGVVWTNDAEGRMSGEQPGWAALTGQTEDEYQGYGWSSAVHPDDAQPSIMAWTRAVSLREPFIFEHRVKTRGGEYRRFAIRALPLLGPDGSIREWVGVHTDVTEQRARERRDAFLLALEDLLGRAATPEEASAGASELLGRSLDAGRVTYAEIDEATDSLTVSREYLAAGMPSAAGTYPLSGLGPALDHYRRGQPIIVTDSRQDPRTAAFAARPDTLAMRTRAMLDMPLVRQGRLVAILAVNHPAPREWTREEVELVRATAERTWDAFERTRAEARIRELNATLERRVSEAVNERNRLWAVSEDLFVTADFTGRLLEVSESWTRLLGWDRETLLRDGYVHLIHPDDLDLARDQLEALQRSGRSVSYENRVLKQDGEWRLIDWTLNMEPDGGRLYGVGRDITRERAQTQALAEVQAQLHEVQKLESIGQLTGGVAHDFNNLLTPIVGALDILSRRVTDDRAQRLITGALQSADRAKTLIQRLLAFARRQTLQPQAVVPAKLVLGMRDLIERSLGPLIEVRLDLPADLPSILVDPNQLELALLNLSLNAHDAMPDGGRLSIAARVMDVGTRTRSGLAPGRYVRLMVSDTGSGMDADTLKRAIEPFFSTKAVGRGTGLGLSMVHGLAAQSGGLFELESRPGEGTTAALWLPVADEQPKAEAVQPHEWLGTGRSVKVLLVDDEDAVRTVAAEGMRELGYEVVEAVNAATALELVGNGLRADIVVTDHMMPGMTGADLAGELRRQQPSLPVLLITGYAHLSPERARGLPVLPKPFRPVELAATLSEMLAAAGR
ncbi:PAS domain S-box protein [Rubellimicrobium rubrum]|nr:PAS domain S-box protein [Rubellimicrobium rubrum]